MRSDQLVHSKDLKLFFNETLQTAYNESEMILNNDINDKEKFEVFNLEVGFEMLKEKIIKLQGFLWKSNQNICESLNEKNG